MWKLCGLLLASLMPLPGLTTAIVVHLGYVNGLHVFPAVFGSSLLGAVMSFHFARNFVRVPASWLKITETSIENSWTMLIAIRLSPSPSSLLSYALGSMHHISFRKYLLATIIGYQKLWIELLIGHSMNEMSYSLRESDPSQTIKTAAKLIGYVSAGFVIAKLAVKQM